MSIALSQGVMARIKGSRLKEFVILKTGEWAGGIVIRVGGGTNDCLSRLPPRRLEVAV